MQLDKVYRERRELSNLYSTCPELLWGTQLLEDTCFQLDLLRETNCRSDL